MGLEKSGQIKGHAEGHDGDHVLEEPLFASLRAVDSLQMKILEILLGFCLLAKLGRFFDAHILGYAGEYSHVENLFPREN